MRVLAPVATYDPGMHQRWSVGALILFVAMAACRGEAEKRVEGLDAQVDRLASFIETIAEAAATSGGDCGKMASDIEAVFVKHEAEMRALRTVLDDADEKRAVEIGEKLMPRMKAIRPKLQMIVDCGEDPRMKAAQERLKALMGGPKK